MDDTVYFQTAFNLDTDNVAYKPDLCAPGQGAVIPNTNLVGTMTSSAAPHVTGAIAVLCSYSPILLTEPALVKSILISSVNTNTPIRYDTTNNPENNYEFVFGEEPNPDPSNIQVINGYRRCGSGILNISNAKQLIDQLNYVDSNITASQTSKTFSLGTIQEGQTVTVSLCFLKRVRIFSINHTGNTVISEKPLANLDLYIRGVSAPVYQPPAAVSSTDYNNVEKIIFTAPTTDEFEITINKISGQNPYEILFAVSWFFDPDVNE